ncbi:MAG: sigma-70 family RNA polymerase sigma factor [Bacteroidia bacterium]|nr:sigma-70 family RNA polymerase sigma factor [Bacteroidia bacterium]
MPPITDSIHRDEYLLSLLVGRDERGMGLLYEQYASLLYPIILRIVRDEAMSQDVLQEMMVRVWHKIHLYEPAKGSLFTWLLHIARHAAIDKTRSRDYLSRQRSRTATMPGYQEPAAAEASETHLAEVIHHLPEHQRLLINMAFFEGFTHEEIAARLDIPLGTIKSRIRSAIQHLRNLL